MVNRTTTSRILFILPFTDPWCVLIFASTEASHKKLLQNAEKTVGAQLSDAETKIAEVQKRARKRMKGLKFVLKELIAETAE